MFQQNSGDTSEAELELNEKHFVCHRLHRNKLEKQCCQHLWFSLCNQQTFAIHLTFCLQVRAYNQKASILEGLDQTHDALHELHLSLECLPGDWNFNSP